MKPFSRSLTFRLTLLFALASTGILALVGYTFYAALGAHFLHEDAIELQGKVELVRNLVARQHAPADFDSLRQRLDDALVGHRNLQFLLRASDGSLLLAVPSEPSPVEQTDRREEGTVKLEGINVRSVAVPDHLYRVTTFSVPTAVADSDSLYGTLVMNVDHHRMFMSRVLMTVLSSVVVGALVAAILGWGVARVGIAPLHAFSLLAARISADRLSDRIAMETLPPELVDLGRSFNAMLARLEDSFRRLKDFSSDLAHELRTPISALMTQAQVAVARSRSEEEYRELLYSAIEEYDRLARMTTDMLFLAKADAGNIVPGSEIFELRPEIQALFDFYDALAESKQVKLEVIGEGAIQGDRSMFRRAVSNLLSNAIRHSESGSSVTIEIESKSRSTRVAVTNQGRPIPSEHLPRLFDRFYMADPARERVSDGSGLGLAITKSIVDTLGGTILVDSNAGRTSFAMDLPAPG